MIPLHQSAAALLTMAGKLRRFIPDYHTGRQVQPGDIIGISRGLYEHSKMRFQLQDLEIELGRNDKERDLTDLKLDMSRKKVVDIDAYKVESQYELDTTQREISDMQTRKVELERKIANF